MNACLVGCVRCTKWVPVLFLMSILAWAYYAYIVELCIYNIGDVAKKSTHLDSFTFSKSDPINELFFPFVL